MTRDTDDTEPVPRRWTHYVFWGMVYALACLLVNLFANVRDHASEQIWPSEDEDED